MTHYGTDYRAEVARLVALIEEVVERSLDLLEAFGLVDVDVDRQVDGGEGTWTLTGGGVELARFVLSLGTDVIHAAGGLHVEALRSIGLDAAADMVEDRRGESFRC
jgi:hypothetical protein